MALIVDMPMPKNCHECWLYCDFTRRMNIDRNEHERPQDCPIKGEIPDEHGDLIDRNEIKLKHDPLYQWFTTAEMLEKVPTVVEAST